MESLTKDQMRKIEDNKRAALQKKEVNSVKPSKSNSNSSSNPYWFKKKQQTYTSSSVKAKCCVVAPDRFTVEMPYHAASVEIFKTISGKLYDPVSKKWTFPLTEHDNLVSKLYKLYPSVNLEAMPKVVVDTLNTPSVNFKDVVLTGKVDEVLLDSLMPFQVEGVRYGVSKNGRCLIADDMGLGKTIQALGIAHYYNENWPLLIVCPSSMRFPWEEAIQNFLPSVNPFYVSVMTSSKDDLTEAQVVIVSYDLMKLSLSHLTQKRFGVIILDESHFLKNLKSARTKAALQLVQKCRRVVLLSGTPALSRPQELYPQIYAIDPNNFKTFHEFGVRYCDGHKSNYGWNYSGSSNMEELEMFLKKRLMIRRLKTEVIQQLPSKMRKLVVLHPNMVKAITKQMNVFARKLEEQKGSERRGTLLAYYCATGSAKLAAVCEYISDKLECSDKFLVFAHHTHVLNGLSDLLFDKKVNFIRIDGSTNPEMRKVLCDKFQTNDNCRVAVLSLKAANSGITLTAAQLVIFAELYWNPGELTQGEDRAHRIGQQDSVVVEYLLAKGTADDHLWSLVQSKLMVLNKAGLSKDNFRETDTEHQDVKGQPSFTSVFQTLEEQPVTDSEEQKLVDLESSFFQDLPAEDDDLFANLDLDGIENEYEIMNKKRKLD